MPRKEQFALGAALVAAALAIILSKSLAWLILFIGLGFVFDFYLRDLIWGTDRLTREQIEKMSAEEYKARVLGNSKTEGWVNWLASGRNAFKKQMRKLAREAVIFMLVTPVLAFVGSFGYLYHDARKPILPVSGIWEPIKCADGDKYIEGGKLVWNCQNGVRTFPGFTPDTSNIPAPPPGFVPIPSSATLDSVPPSPAVPISDLIISALWFGLYGVPAGLSFWLLYRAIRFAIKG